MTETYQLPSAQNEASPNQEWMRGIDPNKPAWDQLEAQGPKDLVGIEFHDADGNLRRISNHLTYMRPIWEESIKGLPRLHMRSQLDHGPIVQRKHEWNQKTEEVDYWTMDIINKDGSLKQVIEFKKAGRKNELRSYLNEVTGFDSYERRTPGKEPQVHGFRISEMDEQDTSDTVKIPVVSKAPKITLNNIRRQADNLGLTSLEGLTWTDEDGNTKQIIRQFSAEPKVPVADSAHYRAVLPNSFYVVKTVANKKDYSTADSKHTYTDNYQTFAKNNKANYKGPDDVIDPNNGQPIKENRFVHIYDASSLDAHFASRTSAPRSPALNDLRFEVPGLKENQPNDAHLVAEGVARLWREGYLFRKDGEGTPKEITDWIGRRALESAQNSEAEKDDGITLNEAYRILHLDRFQHYKNSLARYPKNWQKNLREYKKNYRERVYANILVDLSDRHGIDNILKTASHLSESSSSAMTRLGLNINPEHASEQDVLRDLVKARYYAEHPVSAEKDEFSLTIGDAFAPTLKGRQIQRELVDLRVGKTFTKAALQELKKPKSRRKEVTDNENPKVKETLEFDEQNDKGNDYIIDASVIDLLRLADKPTRGEIDKILSLAVENDGQLPQIGYVRIGRLLNQLAGN
jgi:hypothetical protein